MLSQKSCSAAVCSSLLLVALMPSLSKDSSKFCDSVSSSCGEISAIVFVSQGTETAASATPSFSNCEAMASFLRLVPIELLGIKPSFAAGQEPQGAVSHTRMRAAKYSLAWLANLNFTTDNRCFDCVWCFPPAMPALFASSPLVFILSSW